MQFGVIETLTFIHNQFCVPRWSFGSDCVEPGQPPVTGIHAMWPKLGQRSFGPFELERFNDFFMHIRCTYNAFTHNISQYNIYIYLPYNCSFKYLNISYTVENHRSNTACIVYAIDSSFDCCLAQVKISLEYIVSAIAASLSLVAFAHNIHCTGFLLHTSHITGIVDFSVFLLVISRSGCIQL